LKIGNSRGGKAMSGDRPAMRVVSGKQAVSGDELIARARALAPKLKERAAEAQEDVWGKDHGVFVSASFDPTGRARRVEGGFRFSGRHGFSSGIDHAGWMI